MIAAWFQWIGGGSGVLAIILLLIQRIGDRRTIRANANKAEAEAAEARANADKAEEEAREIALRSQIEADKHMAVLRQGHYDAWLAVKAIREEAAANLESQRLIYERRIAEADSRAEMAVIDKQMAEAQNAELKAEVAALRIEVRQLREALEEERRQRAIDEETLRQAAHSEVRPHD